MGKLERDRMKIQEVVPWIWQGIWDEQFMSVAFILYLWHFQRVSCMFGAVSVFKRKLNFAYQFVLKKNLFFNEWSNTVFFLYHQIHIIKNKWKFFLKDGVMSFNGKDYVFAKAVGDAEW